MPERKEHGKHEESKKYEAKAALAEHTPVRHSFLTRGLFRYE